MKIRVLSRTFFEAVKGTPDEEALLTHHRVISIVSSAGCDAEPPFSDAMRQHEHLLCLRFDDVADGGGPPGCIAFSEGQARAILQFVQDDDLPLLVHCSAGISRSGAVGEVLDWYCNRFLADHEEDHLDFLRHNSHIIPNPLVRRIMLRTIAEGANQ